MPFVVIYDASVLYPSTLRDLLLRVAQAGMVQARWTEEILDEMFAALKRDRPELDPLRLDRTRVLMGTAVRDWKVTGHEPLVDALKLPDPDDRHVLAAAIRARAQVIVTSNLRDFPGASLEAWDVEARSPDDFMRTRSASTVQPSTRRCSRLRTPGVTLRVAWTMCSIALNATVWP